MTITKEIEIDCAHRVYAHQGKCKNLHGHRYKIQVAVDGEVPDSGMVIDFGDLKEIMLEVIDKKLDHSGIFSTQDPDLDLLQAIEKRQIERGGKPFIWLRETPTAENIAKYLYGELKGPLIARDIEIQAIQVHETPSSTAFYQIEDELYDK